MGLIYSFCSPSLMHVKNDQKSCWANLSPSALAAGQDNGRDAWTPSGGCLHCGEQRPPVADGEGTSAQGCRELGG